MSEIAEILGKERDKELYLKYSDGQYHYHIVIPPNVTADIILPDGKKITADSGVYDLYT